MADTLTASLGLTKPQNMGSFDTWGPKLNTDFDLIDAEHTNASKSLRKLTPAADRLPYFNGSGNASGALAVFTAAARTLVACADAAAMRAALSLVIGTNVQAYHAFLATISGYSSIANLTAFVGLTGTADKIAYFTGAGAMALSDMTAFGRSLLTMADANTLRTLLGLGGTAYLAYQTGTFTPAVVGTTTAGAASGGTQAGRFTRIGRICHFSLNASWTAHTGTGNMAIDGLPYLAAVGASNQVFSALGSNLTFGGTSFRPFIAHNTDRIIFNFETTAGATGPTPMDTSASILISGVYEIVEP
jgi:hypothetical protein